MNGAGLTTGSSDLADLVAVHLQDEEAVLAAALPMVRALKAAFTGRSREAIPELADRQFALAGVLEDMKLRRQRFRELISRRFQCDADAVTMSRIVKGLPTRHGDELVRCAERVKKMAQEFVTINRWLAIHLRVHLEAYQRLLRDLTGTAHGSGRYGPEGAAETGDLRPLIQIQG